MPCAPPRRPADHSVREGSTTCASCRHQPGRRGNGRAAQIQAAQQKKLTVHRKNRKARVLLIASRETSAVFWPRPFLAEEAPGHLRSKSDMGNV